MKNFTLIFLGVIFGGVIVFALFSQGSVDLERINQDFEYQSFDESQTPLFTEEDVQALLEQLISETSNEFSLPDSEIVLTAVPEFVPVEPIIPTVENTSAAIEEFSGEFVDACLRAAVENRRSSPRCKDAIEALGGGR